MRLLPFILLVALGITSVVLWVRIVTMAAEIGIKRSALPAKCEDGQG